jgi:Flp pilus assembly protein protease CpaA
MEWFSRTTSIAGIQIPNWVVVLGVIIVIWLIYKFGGWSTVAETPQAVGFAVSDGVNPSDCLT